MTVTIVRRILGETSHCISALNRSQSSQCRPVICAPSVCPNMHAADPDTYTQCLLGTCTAIFQPVVTGELFPMIHAHRQSPREHDVNCRSHHVGPPQRTTNLSTHLNAQPCKSNPATAAWSNTVQHSANTDQYISRCAQAPNGFYLKPLGAPARRPSCPAAPSTGRSADGQRSARVRPRLVS